MGTVCARQHRDDGSNDGTSPNAMGNANSSGRGNAEGHGAASGRDNGISPQNSQRMIETMSILASKSYRNNIYCACDNYYCVNNYDLNYVNGIFKAKMDLLNKKIKERKESASFDDKKCIAVESNTVDDEEQRKLYMHRPKSLLQLCVETVAENIVNGKISSIKMLPQDLVQQVFDHLISNNRLTDTMIRTCFKDSSLVNLDLSKIRCLDDGWADTLMMLASSAPSTANSSLSSSPLPSQYIDETSLMLTSELSRSHSNSDEEVSSNIDALRSKMTDAIEFENTQQNGDYLLNNKCDQFFYGIERIKLSSCRDVGIKTMHFVSRAPMLSELLLDGCVNVNDEMLESIKGNVRMRHLSLSGCIAITSQGLNKAISNYCSLQSLRLDSCWNISKLSFLERLQSIETLSLGWCYNVGDQDVSVIKSLTNLTNLDISKTSITDSGLKDILSSDKREGSKRTAKPLSHLKLDGCNISGASLKLLGERSKSSKIKELSLQWCLITDKDLEYLSCLQSISVLNLSYTQVSCQGMRHVSELVNLSTLKLDSCNINDFGVQYLTNRRAIRNSYDKNTKSSITELDLSDTNISNVGLKSITEHMPDMKCLNLSYTAVNDDGVEHLKGLRNLTSLNLDSHSITDTSLRHVSHLTSIRHLDLFGSKVTDNGLRLICTLTFSNLKSLEVCGGGVTDVGVRYISRSMALLESLNLANNHRISDEAMPSICLLKNLKNLNLTHSRVTSEGILHLLNLRRLESLSVHECKINKSAITKLQQSIRSLKSIGAMNMKTTSGLTFSSLFDLRQL